VANPDAPGLGHFGERRIDRRRVIRDDDRFALRVRKAEAGIPRKPTTIVLSFALGAASAAVVALTFRVTGPRIHTALDPFITRRPTSCP
jgi:hypothetical protein